MNEIIELAGKKNRWSLSPLGARIVSWNALDGGEWRGVCRGDASKKPSQDGHHQSVMFPWVNRIGGESWTCDGEVVPINLSGRHTHLHGLVTDAAFEITARTASSVSMRAILERHVNYPRRVEARVSYSIVETEGAEGMVYEIVGRNLEGEKNAFITAGIHPYFLNPFGGEVDEMELYCDAEREFAVDDRLIPTGLTPVTVDHDFRKQRHIGATEFDSGFVLARGASPAARIAIRNYSLEIHPVENCGYLQIYIPPHRAEVAMEPQSGGADAFRVPEYGLTILKPGVETRHAARMTAKFE